MEKVKELCENLLFFIIMDLLKDINFEPKN